MANILIVDDSDTLRMQLKDILTNKGHQVIEAVDGNEGLKKARDEQHLDLIISDYNMPEMDGITMCGKIHELEQHAKVPIFMLTTESSSELKKMGKEVGVMAWIVKPFVSEKLIMVIEKVLSRKAS